MKFSNRQRGMGLGGWLMMILVFGGVLTMGLKLFPVYMDHSTMKGVLEGIGEEPGLAGKKNGDIYALIDRRFDLNAIRDYPIEDHIKINRHARGVDLIMDYEVRMDLISNVDLIASFHEEVALKE